MDCPKPRALEMRNRIEQIKQLIETIDAIKAMKKKQSIDARVWIRCELVLKCVKQLQEDNNWFLMEAVRALAQLVLIEEELQLELDNISDTFRPNFDQQMDANRLKFETLVDVMMKLEKKELELRDEFNRCVEEVIDIMNCISGKMTKQLADQLTSTRALVDSKFKQSSSYDSAGADQSTDSL